MKELGLSNYGDFDYFFEHRIDPLT